MAYEIITKLLCRTGICQSIVEGAPALATFSTKLLIIIIIIIIISKNAFNIEML